MNQRGGIAQFEATVILVVISLALASVVYDGLSRESAVKPEPVFVNAVTPMSGTLGIERVTVNASETTTLSEMTVDSTSSALGILAFNGKVFEATSSLCSAGETTLFSVYAAQAGDIQVAANGESWVSGTWGASVPVAPGWQEVMVANASSCSVTLPGGLTVPSRWTPSSPLLSSIPALGSFTATAFTLYLPAGDGAHSLLLVTSGGLDDVSV